MLQVSIYHARSGDPQPPGDSPNLCVETNLRCSSCRRPLLLLVEHDGAADIDAITAAMLREYRRLEGASCVGVPIYRRTSSLDWC